MPLSLDQLVAIARNYWPTPGKREQDSSLEFSPEALRLHELWEQKLKDIARWWTVLDELRNELPGFVIGDATATPDACFRCVAHPSGASSTSAPYWSVVGCLSIIAPVHTVYGVQFTRHERARVFEGFDFELGRAETRAPAHAMARRFELGFGSQLLPAAQSARVQVDLEVQGKRPPDTLLLHALFTNEPENLP